jgi:hypothetical protein
MSERFILLIEDISDDEALGIGGLQKNCVLNEVTVPRDGVEAIGFSLESEDMRDGMSGSFRRRSDWAVLADPQPVLHW